MNPESKLMHQIEIALCQHDCWVIRTNSGIYYGQNGERVRVGFVGLPDLIGCTKDGKIFFLEIKTPGGYKRPEQIKFIEWAKSRGYKAGFAHSVEEALEIVKGEVNG